MDNLSQTFEYDGDELHPPAERFLLFVDGELVPKEAARWQSHLDACWSCRVRVGKIQETIADIIEFEDAVSSFQFSNSSPDWGNFNSRLNALSREIGEKSVKSRFFGFWKQLQQFRSFNWMSKMAASTLAALLIFAVFYQFLAPAPVSASELLEKAATAQQEKIKTANQPVVYQKLKISQADKSVVLEVWNEIGTAKNKKSSAAIAAQENADVLSEYEAALERNNFDPRKPLSSEIFRAWRVSLADKTDTVSQIETANGENAFRLTTAVGDARENGEIVRASLIVRQTDWHAVSQTIQVKIGDEIKTFEVSEMDFEVLNRDVLAKNFFGEDGALAKEIALAVKPSPNVSPKDSPSPDAEKSPETIVKAESSPNAPPVAAASVDLEVEVLNLLNQAKADTGEQITVARENGLLKVRGIVETTERKKEILTALQPVSGNPSVRIEINTVAEAVAAEKNKSKNALTVQKIQTENSSTATENDLIEHLGSAEKARAFAASTVNRSSRAMSRAYALKRLVGQFKPEELRQMSPDARAKWLALVQSHARAFQTETENLRAELQQVFGAPNAVAATNTPPVNNAGDVPRAVEALLGYASDNDRIVRSALTVSAGGTQFSAIKTRQFWQSLKNAEALAARLQTVK